MHTYTHSQSQLENNSDLNISKEQFTIANNEQTERLEKNEMVI